MSEEKLQESMVSEENKVLIIMGIIFGVIWIILFVVDITSPINGVSGFIYFLYGLLNVGVFLLYMKSKSKKDQDKWIKTSLFDEKEEKPNQ